MGTSTIRFPGRQSGSSAHTLPVGSTRAATPGKSSSLVEPAWVATAIHKPRSRAWRRASPRPWPRHHSQPRLQAASSMRRPQSPGAAQKSTSSAPTAAACANGRSTPPSAQIAIAHREPSSSNVASASAAGIALLTFAEMALPLHADDPSVLGGHLGDVRGAPLSALGDPEHRRDSGLGREPDQRGDRRIVERHEGRAMVGRIQRARQRHLREHRQRAARAAGLAEHAIVLGEVVVHRTLLALESRQQDAHADQ